MTALTVSLPDQDTRRRLRPSREQLRVAAAMFAAAPEEVTSVVVPIVLAERLEHPGGYWLADRGTPEGAYGYRAARDAAEAAAAAHLQGTGRRGLPAWVAIRPNGTWAAFDGFALD